jgi:hypothetical protein
MAGLAATLDMPGTIEMLATALAPRGDDGALCRLAGRAGARLDLAMRAVIPSIARVVGGRSGSTPVGAFAIDGIASVTRLDTGYGRGGPLGLLGGEEPYAVIFADAERGELVIARNGDGPGLYYAALDHGWLVASEPMALLSAGVPAEPDPGVVKRFIESGTCDDTDATFFGGIRRVLAGEAVVLGRQGRLRRHTAHGAGEAADGAPGDATDAVDAIADAVRGGRIAIRLAPGLAGAAVLGVTLDRADRPRPVPVHTVTFPGLAGPAAHTPAILVPLPHGAIRHTPHVFAPKTLDLDGFLRDMGEPVPDLDYLLSWEVVRRCGGDTVDTLVDSSTAEGSCTSRVSDRTAARYGVGLCCPLRQSTMDIARLRATVSRTLPASVGRYAVTDSAGPVTPNDLLWAWREDVAATMAGPPATDRIWADRNANVDSLSRFYSGQMVDVDALFRAYLVERWLRVVVGPFQPRPAAGRAPTVHTVRIDRTMWTVAPLRTEVFSAGDRVPESAAWHVANAFASPEPDSVFDADPTGVGPWLAILSAKPLAVSQHRVRPLWEIRPGRVAHTLSRLAQGRLPRLAEPWTMQVAIEDGGLVAVGAGVLATRAGLTGWARRILPREVLGLFPPRAGAVAPADGAVIGAPVRPDEAAAAMVRSLRHALPARVARRLIGTAVVAAGPSGCRVLGYGPGPAADLAPDVVALIDRLCADDPAGQADERTPLVLAFRARATARRAATPAARTSAARTAGSAGEPDAAGAGENAGGDYRADERSAASFSSTSTRRPS